MNTRIALATTQKGNLSVTEYMTHMRALSDEMIAAGKPLDDEELVSYILAGLDLEFNPVVSAVVAKVEPITVGELYSQLLSFEQRVDLYQRNQAGSSANSAGRGRGGFDSHGRAPPRQRGRGGPPQQQHRGGGNNNSGSSRPSFNPNNRNNNRSNNGTSALNVKSIRKKATRPLHAGTIMKMMPLRNVMQVQLRMAAMVTTGSLTRELRIMSRENLIG